MKNSEKDELRNQVKLIIAKGRDIQYAVARLSRVGFNKATIRRYYKAHCQFKDIKEVTEC